jgi:hypothetical protein
LPKIRHRCNYPDLLLGPSAAVGNRFAESQRFEAAATSTPAGRAAEFVACDAGTAGASDLHDFAAARAILDVVTGQFTSFVACLARGAEFRVWKQFKTLGWYSLTTARAFASHTPILFVVEIKYGWNLSRSAAIIANHLFGGLIQQSY